MRQSTRLIVNTCVTYARMVLTVGIGLTIARLVIQTLGFVDFGLLTALGASGAFLLMINSSLTRSAQRHLAYEIGTGNQQQLRIVFNSTLGIFLALAVFIWVTGQALRPLLFKVLTIPPGRENAAFWVFQVALIQMMLSVASTPFRAALNAHQAMILLAWSDVLGRLVELGIVLLLVYLPWDRLISYSGLMLGLAMASALSPVWVTTKWYPECRPNLKLFRWAQVREIGGFAGWSMFNQVGWDLRNQGSVIILNSFFGPVVNGAYSIGLRVMAYQNQLVFTLLGALQPATTSMEGRGGTEQVKHMVCLAGKYTVLASLFVFTPMMLEAEGLLKLWLGKYPPDAPLFTRLLTTMVIVGVLGSGHRIAIEAKGNIAKLALWTSIPLYISMGVVGLLYYLFPHTFPAWLLPASFAVLALIMVPGIILYVGPIIGLPLHVWMKKTLKPILMVFFISAGASLVIHLLLQESIRRVLAVTAVNAFLLLATIWPFAIEQWEKQHFIRIFNAVLHWARNTWNPTTSQ